MPSSIQGTPVPRLLLAAPSSGSGKTTVLITRLGYMTEVCGVTPESILTMTYTIAATREMRARFAARFGFAIDPATGQAARALCRHLDCVSEERIAEELSRLLAAPVLQGVHVTQGYHPYPTSRRAKIRLLCFRGHDGLSFFSLVTLGEVSCLSVIGRTGLCDTQLHKQRGQGY